MAILCAAFFVACAAASAGYLTVSETFPLEIRAMAIALFYAISTGIGGAVGPLLFGKLLGGDDPTGVAVGYWIAAGLMAIAAIVEIVLRRRRRAAVARGGRRAAVGDLSYAAADSGAGRAAGQQVVDEPVHASPRASGRWRRAGARRACPCRAARRAPPRGRQAKMRVSAASRMRACSPGRSLRGPQLVECLYNAPVGLCAFVGHDTWSP